VALSPERCYAGHKPGGPCLRLQEIVLAAMAWVMRSGY